MEEILAKSVADKLRRDILRGKLLPGQTITERDQALALGVSRTPLREALRMLAHEGLIELRPARSPIVANPSRKEVLDQTRLLIALEKLSAELACANATQDELDHMAGIVAIMDKKFDEVDALDMFEIDMDFHATMVKASDNRALFDAHERLFRKLWRARYLVALKRRSRERLVDQHSRLVEALRARDEEAVKAAVDAHFSNLVEDLSRVYEDEERSNLEAQTQMSAD